MNFLKKKITREIAIVLSLLLAVMAAYIGIDGLFAYQKFTGARDSFYSGNSIDSELAAESRLLASRLWLVLNMYEANVDENGKITGNEKFRASLLSEMKSAGLVDNAGKLILPSSDKYYYSMEVNGKVISNDKSAFDTPETGKYTETINIDSHGFDINTSDYAGIMIPDFYFYDNRCYTNTRGMYYYYCDGKGYAVYDYDTSGLEYYYDTLGARIYINSDGTIPVPDVYNDTEYQSFDHATPIDERKMKNVIQSHAIVKILPHPEVVDAVEKNISEFNSAETAFMRKLVYALALLALASVFGIYIIASGGYDEKTGKFVMRTRDGIYGEIFVLTGIFIPVVCFIAGPGISYDAAGALNRMELDSVGVKAVGSFCFAALFMMVIGSADTIVNRFKCKKVTDTFLVTSVFKKMTARMKDVIGNIWMSRNEAFTIRFFIRIAEAAAAGIIAVAIGILTRQFFIIPVAALIILALYVYESMKDLKELNDLSRQITGISSGDYTPKITSKTSVTYGMTTRLNCISDGIQTAVEEQIRSERMKIELVTNVSHDLKTPLTSIISYVDLLSREELPPAAMDYVAVLEQKTDRLRTIVSDVFDLAKATSSTDVNIERLDAVILMNQVLADMSDKQERYGREIKTEIKADSAFIDAEGKKMYRVLQNILDNALKYSMNGTRVFAKLEKANGNVKITVKNTSSYEMDFSPEEITERFARGDKARTTEGSGLGLSIAKSFTEACGGRFDIKIDGDLFIAEVEFPEVQTGPEAFTGNTDAPHMQ